MSMTLGSFANGAGYVYVTAPDGVSIISNLENDPQIWQQVQKLANTSASLTDPTLESDSTYGYRFFGNTSGSQGVLAGSTEMTRFFVNRGAQTAAYKKSVTIATGVITLNRVSNDTTLIVSTEGGIADQLDTITMAGVVDNDTVTIVGANSGAGGIITVPNATGNIFLSASTSFVSGARGVELVLRYFSASTAGWYEVSRNAVFPTPSQARASGVPAPVSGVNTTSMATSGTTTLVPGTDIGYQVVTGSPVLVGSVVYATGGSPLNGDEFTVDYRATPTIGGNTVTIFGITLTAAQTQQRVVVTTKYNLTNTTWYSSISSNVDGVNYATTTQLATKQDTLPSSGGDTFVLQKTIAGALSFVPIPSPTLYGVVSSLFTVTTDASLSNVPGATVPITSVGTYIFTANVYIGADPAGGTRYSIGGTFTASYITYQVLLISNAGGGAFTISSTIGDLITDVSEAGTTDGICIITGTFVASTIGSLVLKFGQDTATGSSSVNKGSYIYATRIA